MEAGTIAIEDYEFIRRLVYDRSRINLGPNKAELVRSRVQKRLRALGMENFQSYCRLLESAAGEEEMTALLDVISTNVTDFFREVQHFDFLEAIVLPEWHRKTGSRLPFRVWSAACSSGEEPYSIAILLSEYGRTHRALDWSVTATDISTRMLTAAEQAVYRSDRVKLPDSEWLARYFQKGVGAREGFYRVKPGPREHVDFRHLNLFHWPYPFTEKFDVIFCRNVMIYFDRDTQQQLVPRLAEQLTPGGHLFVGHSESLIGIGRSLKSVQPSVYRHE